MLARAGKHVADQCSLTSLLVALAELVQTAKSAVPVLSVAPLLQLGAMAAEVTVQQRQTALPETLAGRVAAAAAAAAAAAMEAARHRPLAPPLMRSYHPPSSGS